MNERYLPLTLGGKVGRVVEEAGEVLQMYGKIVRFGMFSRHPDGGPHNTRLFFDEILDLRHAIDELLPDLQFVLDQDDQGKLLPGTLQL